MGNSAFPSSPNQADARVIRLRSAHLSLDAPFAAMSFPMPNKMLIDATHPEETRVVVVRGNRVEEFDFESAQRKQLRGNIYLAKVTRVEPSADHIDPGVPESGRQPSVPASAVSGCSHVDHWRDRSQEARRPQELQGTP